MIKRLALICAFFAQTAFAAEFVKNHDGDTIKISEAGQIVTIRLEYIDAPELKQTMGKEAKEALYNLCSKADITYTQSNKKSFNRVVSELYCNHTNVNQYLVKNGFAILDYRYAKGKTDYIALESEAKQNRRGVWNIENMHTPKECRTDKKMCM
ncbi:MAG TPA: thermonuclease family protein [Bacteroidia bacterium]|nr:thermonuclease family protein [Bacteroidia bacterium]